MKSLRLTLYSLFIFVSTIFSQDFELAGIKYLNYPAIDSNDFSIQEFGAFINIPTKLKNDKTILINGLFYGQVRINDLKNHISIIDQELVLHSISYRFMLLHKFNKKWAFIGVLEPTLASDFESSLSSDDLVLQSMAIASKTINTKLNVGAGLLYSTRFGQPMVIPVMPIKFNSNKHRINALLPTRVLYAYEATHNFDIGIKAAVNGANFNLTGFSNQIDDVNKVNYTRANIGPVIYYKPKKKITLELTGGISTNRRYNLVQENEDVIETTLPTQAFFNLGLVIKPDIND
ncbi:hypothetical protein GCM10022393_23630 [Aquimarina addita]|uniref:DUF6268 domain-containing protein n=1 Tax=Aquimarina addita TaxID=870485 RepID=A0ABP6UJW4_9FLAO